MFDPSAWHITILLIVVLLLFGSSRLPGAANALGKSMHIFKKSVHGLSEDGQPTPDPAATTTTQATLPPPATPQPLTGQPSTYDAVHQQQLADLQRQVQDLQRQNVGTDGGPVNAAGTTAPEAQRSQQPF